MRKHRNRLGELGSAYHVYSRGLDRKPIFRDDRDRNAFLLILRDALQVSGTRCFGFGLMANHYHLALKTVERPISSVMHRLNQRYAIYHNRRHGGVGHLFQGRFQSVLIEDDDHLRTVLLYVHLNPVRAGIVPGEYELRGYRWTGHGALMGRVPHEFIDVERVLSWFGPTRDEARRSLGNAMRRDAARAPERATDGAASITPSELASAIPRRMAEDLRARNVVGIAGDSERVHKALRARNMRTSIRLRLHAEGWTSQTLLVAVCRVVGVATHVVRAGGRSRDQSRARALYCHLATEHLGLTQAAAGRAVGVSGVGALKAARAGRQLAEAEGLAAADIFAAEWLRSPETVESGS
jgi:REP element-mobilizing transposase RayT